MTENVINRKVIIILVNVEILCLEPKPLVLKSKFLTQKYR